MNSNLRTGIIIILFVLSLIIFLFWIGEIDPFSGNRKIHIQYEYSAGLEKGAPVRLMGLRAGKVTDIRLGEIADNGYPPRPCILATVTISRQAWMSLHSDAHFYITISGLVGEKYIEITPGTSTAPPLIPGSVCRGIDPPRLDLLLAQSTRLTEELFHFMERNEGSIISMMNTGQKFIETLNRAMLLAEKSGDPETVARLIRNVTELSGNLAALTNSMRGKDGEEMIVIINRLLHRLDQVDEKTVRKFLQEEGVKARIF